MDGDVTWPFSRFASATWEAPGGEFAEHSSAVAPVGTAGASVWDTTSALVEDVQSWLEAPDSNHGWVLIGDDFTPQSAKRFVSREGLGESFPPRLVVEYVLGCEDAGLEGAALGSCRAYCDALRCGEGAPRSSESVCSRAAQRFANASGGRPLPCDHRDGDAFREP